jgi:uncharacterized membrane protein YdbT with pleckstrin-like domain
VYFWHIFWFAVKVAILAGIYYLFLYFIDSKVLAAKTLKPEDEALIAEILSIAFLVFAALLLIGLLFFILRVLTLRSTVLFIDNDGVWVYSGIFPWSRGSTGVKWRDIDSASCKISFFSWLFKTYDIRVGHRFTKESEIVLYNIFNGHKAIEYINERHKNFIANVAPEMSAQYL